MIFQRHLTGASALSGKAQRHRNDILSLKCCCITALSDFIHAVAARFLQSWWLAKQHKSLKWKDAIYEFRVTPGAEVLLRWGDNVKLWMLAFCKMHDKKLSKIGSCTSRRRWDVLGRKQCCIDLWSSEILGFIKTNFSMWIKSNIIRSHRRTTYVDVAYCYTSLSDCGPTFRMFTDPNPKPSIALTLLTLNLTLLTQAVTLTLNFGISDFQNGGPVPSVGLSVGLTQSWAPQKG